MTDTIQTLLTAYLDNRDYDGDPAKQAAALSALRGLRIMRAQGMNTEGTGFTFQMIDAEIAKLETLVTGTAYSRSSITRVRAVRS